MSIELLEMLCTSDFQPSLLEDGMLANMREIPEAFKLESESGISLLGGSGWAQILPGASG